MFLFNIIGMLFDVLQYAIIIDVLLSYIPSSNLSGLKSFINSLTSPILMPFQKLQASLFPNMMFDFSPIFAIILLNFLRRLLFSILL
ncbi:YggT family protein [Clostridium polynesiense]|uniref:YggT family protein n=1 Tax=Clostridium polynesiense TaxID=1325933 RepID=UPI00058BE00C|nr:YggT family protein [Clostridium polynesiense]